MTPLVRMVCHRHPTDCGIAALAMFLNVSYEDALLALGGKVLQRGVWLPELQRAARTLGVTLKRRESWDYDADDGILRVKWRGGAHVLLLRAGLLWDTDLACWKPDEYLKATRRKATAILVREA